MDQHDPVSKTNPTSTVSPLYPNISRPRVNGALLTMPIIIFNMGTEMIYILQQRIKAQEIPTDKARKVIADVLKAMFSPTFIDELFRPQELYRYRDTRAVFERLAHASIMRLNKSSMDKLMDLMTMGFKYQISSISTPMHILQLTLNHIETLQTACDDPQINHQIQLTIIRIIETYSRLPMGELFALKYACVRFIQNRLVKVSVFMEENIQTNEGVILLDTSGPLPPGTDILGTIKYYTYHPINHKRTEIISKLPSLPQRGTFSKPEGNPLDAKTRACKLGNNLYLKERKKPTDGTSSDSKATEPSTTKPSVSSTANGPTVAEAPKDDEEEDTSSSSESKEDTSSKNTVSSPTNTTKRTGLASVNLLASLLGNESSSGNNNTTNFQFNLFSDDGLGFNTNNTTTSSNVNKTVTFQNRQDSTSSAHTMLSALGLQDTATTTKKSESKENNSKEDDENDLLDLLDSL